MYRWYTAYGGVVYASGSILSPLYGLNAMTRLDAGLLFS
jgi:hypothetical protein